MRRSLPSSIALAVATALLITAASGLAEPPGGPRPPEPLPSLPRPVPEDPPQIERYRIEGGSTADGCGGRIYLAVRIITVNRALRTVFADVVNRTYRAQLSRDRLIATGRFNSRTACPRGVTERWDLARSGPNELRGTLESSWLLAPDCEPCTITFQVRAVRIR